MKGIVLASGSGTYDSLFEVPTFVEVIEKR